jgi:uncharacterized membrane protein
MMNSPASGLRVASLIFAVVALAQLVRFLAQAQVTIGSHTIPVWISALLALVAAVLSLWMWKLSK